MILNDIVLIQSFIATIMIYQGTKIHRAVLRTIHFLLIMFTIQGFAYSQSTGDYRTVASGNWNDTLIWQRYNGAVWVRPSTTPDYNSGIITVRGGHTVTLNIDITVDELVVGSLGILSINSSKTMTLNGNTTVTGTLSLNGNYICGSFITSGTGAFRVNSGATLVIGSASGIATSGATGNIQTTTRVYNAAANYTYNCGSMQVPGNGLPTTLTGNLIVNTTHTSGLVLPTSYTINSPGNMYVNGVLNPGAYLIRGTGSFSLNANGTLYISNSSGITTSGAVGVVQTTGRTYSGAANYIYNGITAQSPGNGLPTTLTGNLTFTNASAAGITLTSSYVLDSPAVCNVTGVLKMAAYTFSGTGTFSLSSTAGLYIGSASGISSSGSTGNVQTSVRSFSSSANYFYYGSIAQISGSGLPSTLNGNLTISTTHVSGVSLSTGININSPGIFLVSGVCNASTYTVGGSGTFTLNAGGTLIIGSTDGIVTSGPVGNIQTSVRNFNSAGNYKYISANSQDLGSGLPTSLTGTLTLGNTNTAGIILNKHITVNTPGLVSVTGVLDMGLFTVRGTGSFTLGPTGTLIISSPDGISASGNSGNVLTTFRTFNPAANYTYNSIYDQDLGNGLPTALSGRLTISNTSSNGIVLSTNYIINTPGIMSVNGILKPNSAIIRGTGTFSLNAGATLYINSPSGITSSGATGQIQTSTRLFSNAANYTYNGTFAQVTGTALPTNLNGMVTILNTAGVTLSASHILNSSAVFYVNGSLKCSTYTVSGGGSFLLDSAASIYIGSVNGIGTSGNISTTSLNLSRAAYYNFIGTQAQFTGSDFPVVVNNLIINNSSGVSLSKNLTMNGTLTLTSGALCLNGKVLTVNSNKTITRLSGSISLCGGSMSFNGSGVTGTDLTYLGSAGLTTGPEMPTNATALRNLTINNPVGVTLGSDITVNGQLTLTRGAITPSGHTVSYGIGSSLIYNGTFFQNASNTEWPASFDKDIIINNTSGGGVALNANKTSYSGNLIVNTILNVGSFVIQGSGNFTLAAGATYVTANTKGIANNSSIQVSGRSFSSAANYVFNGTSAQITGTELPTSVATLNINNAKGVNLSGNVTVTGALILTAGAFSIGSHILNIGAGIVNSGGSITGGLLSDITFSGSGGATTLPAISGGIQNLTINRGNGITMGANTTVHSNLGLTTGSFLLGANTLTLNGAVTTGSGSLTGGATSNLNIGGSGSAIILPTIQNGLHNFLLNRTSGVDLSDHLSVRNAVTFVNGVINLGDYNFTIESGGSVSGYNSNNYFVTNNDPSPVGALIRPVGTSSVVFPVGTNSYNPVTVSNTGVQDNFSVRVFDDVLESGISGGRIPNLRNVVNKTWLVEEETSGGSNVTLNFQWNDADQDRLFDTNTAVVWHYTSGAWDRISGRNTSMVTPGVHQCFRTGITSFSPFSVGSDNTPLPVDLLNFDAALKLNSVETRWTTAQEINNAYFEVERSADGIHYEAIGKIDGAGTSAMLNNYQFSDREPLSGISYYRLKQTDFNGLYSYSGIQKITNAHMIVKSGNAYPNPFKNDISVKFKGDKGQTTEISLADQNGRIIFRESKMNSGFENQFSYNTSLLPKGLYILYIQSGADLSVQKLTREE